MRIAIIGVGNMGGALARAWASAQMTPPVELIVANPHSGKLEALKAEHPQVGVTCCNREAADGADVVLLAVKPWKVEEVVLDIRDVLDYRRQQIVSVAAGIGTECLSAWLRRDDGSVPAVCYAIPNTAVGVGCGMTFFASAHATPEQDGRVERLFAAVGRAVRIEERLLPAATALASCGTAYALRYMRAATEGAVELGLPPAVALEAVAQTVRGAAELISLRGTHPEQEIDRVTTPGGLTIRGLNAMEDAGFTRSVIQGLRASVPGGKGGDR